VSVAHWLIVKLSKGLTGLICRIDDKELERVPRQGPLIIYTNHVNILEIPIIYTHLQPRKVHGMLLAERWKIPVVNWALDVTQTIPLHRGEADLQAVRMGLQALGKEEMLIIAPEGTRSHDGKLQPAHPGVVLLALHSGGTLLPVGFYGAENYTENLRKLKRTDFHLRVGRPFHLDARSERVTREVRQAMVEEMMYQLALVLPLEYRGNFADGSVATQKYLVFEK
jgi:1-acyl-sn-glycerol-3-phosphate acyltransferase